MFNRSGAHYGQPTPATSLSSSGVPQPAVHLGSTPAQAGPAHVTMSGQGFFPPNNGQSSQSNATYTNDCCSAPSAPCVIL